MEESIDKYLKGPVGNVECVMQPEPVITMITRERPLTGVVSVPMNAGFLLAIVFNFRQLCIYFLNTDSHIVPRGPVLCCNLSTMTMEWCSNVEQGKKFYEVE